jgi:hypothetical protein
MDLLPHRRYNERFFSAQKKAMMGQQGIYFQLMGALYRKQAARHSRRNGVDFFSSLHLDAVYRGILKAVNSKKVTDIL